MNTPTRMFHVKHATALESRFRALARAYVVRSNEVDITARPSSLLKEYTVAACANAGTDTPEAQNRDYESGRVWAGGDDWHARTARTTRTRGARSSHSIDDTRTDDSLRRTGEIAARLPIFFVHAVAAAYFVSRPYNLARLDITTGRCRPQARAPSLCRVVHGAQRLDRPDSLLVRFGLPRVAGACRTHDVGELRYEPARCAFLQRHGRAEVLASHPRYRAG